jgi:hypothetical protein
VKAVRCLDSRFAADVRLDDEHDRYEWLSLEQAAARCLPVLVGESFRRVAASLP